MSVNVWYIVRVHSGKELDFVRRAVQISKKIFGDDESCFPEIFMDETGREDISKISRYMGYVLVRVSDLERAKYVLSKIDFAYFLCDEDGDCKYATDDEVLDSKDASQCEDEVRLVSDGVSEYVIGDEVNIKSGPFGKFSGVVNKVFKDRSRLEVRVKILDVPTDINVSFDDVVMKKV